MVLNKSEKVRMPIYKRKHFNRYVLLAPAVIATLIFCYLPFAGITIAFKDFDIIKGFSGSPWVGLKNFKAIFSSAEFISTFWRTLWYSSVIMFGQFPFPILLALMFNELRGKTFKKVSQTLTYLPHFLSMITVVGLFYGMLSTNGTINTALSNFLGDSYQKKNILLESNYFLPIIFSAQLWKELGWSSVIYLAAIAGIDKGLYEAAAIDGCGKIKQALYITLPGISETIVILLVMNMGNLFNVGFDLVYGFQNIYTQKYTEVISTLIYRQGITSGNYSVATAFGLLQGIIGVFLVFVTNKFAKKFFDTSIW